MKSERFEDVFFVFIAILFAIVGAIGYFIADYKISKCREEMKIVCKELKNNPELYKRLKNCDNYVEKEWFLSKVLKEAVDHEGDSIYKEFHNINFS